MAIPQADQLGLLIYTAWREDQLAKEAMDKLYDDPEMERLCTRIVEWPWDGIVQE